MFCAVQLKVAAVGRCGATRGRVALEEKWTHSSALSTQIRTPRALKIQTVGFAHFVKRISVCAFIHTSVKTMGRTRPVTPARPGLQYSPVRIAFSAFMFALQLFKHAGD